MYTVEGVRPRAGFTLAFTSLSIIGRKHADVTCQGFKRGDRPFSNDRMFGNKNRLGMAEKSSYSSNLRSFDENSTKANNFAPNQDKGPVWVRAGQKIASQAWSVVLYRYYNWREDTLSDLTLFIGFSGLLFLVAADIEVCWFWLPPYHRHYAL